ncbi:Hypothetical predicted protein [Olea europaea subsp. europaea]|uniref:Uncharacterized protein n=1 Tax=Olea europaea subsp. europaea TaxID=158383 RepID=A0A8S0STJ1_OLEEU|nr:Hypothetical predicted protein [Olea europaea subsp. europaea]
MQKLESLTRIQLTNICGLTSVIKAFDQFPSTLESLSVDGCEDLATLLPSDDTAQNLVNLREVYVKSCPRLSSLQEIDVLPGLRSLTITKCGALELLPNKISFLENLSIGNCPSLKTVMKLQDCSTSLNFLSINRWVNLNLTNLLGSGHDYTSLTSIFLWRCDGLESFPHGGLPTPNLRHLDMDGCRHLKSLPDQMDLLSALLFLSVFSCDSLITLFPQGDIPPNLTYLDVVSCASLMELFPKQNIPPNLSYLNISDCQKLRPLGEWGLHTLTSLNSFKFSGFPELVSLTNNVDEEHCVLPPSLTSLSLRWLPNLETLSNGFQSLTSLQHMYIEDCPKLVALPLEGQLQKLLSLSIDGCPRLKKRCLKNKGDHWPIIADIPDVRIDCRSIYDPCP